MKCIIENRSYKVTIMDDIVTLGSKEPTYDMIIVTRINKNFLSNRYLILCLELLFKNEVIDDDIHFC